MYFLFFFFFDLKIHENTLFSRNNNKTTPLFFQVSAVDQMIMDGIEVDECTMAMLRDMNMSGIGNIKKVYSSRQN